MDLRGTDAYVKCNASLDLALGVATPDVENDRSSESL